MTTPLIVLDIIKIMFDILNLKFKYFGFTAIIKNEYKCSYSLNTYKYLKFMNDKTATLPKNTILNFLYSTDRQVSLELLLTRRTSRICDWLRIHQGVLPGMWSEFF